MQTKIESILRGVNNPTKKNLNILSFVTHESFSQNLGGLDCNFYLFQSKEHGTKPWDYRYRPLPKNHILLDGSASQVHPTMKFDAVLSQNRYCHWQLGKTISQHIGVPFIQIEHCLPPPQFTSKQIDKAKEMGGDLNVFISEYNCKAWHYDPEQPTNIILRHGIDTEIFRPSCMKSDHTDGKILSVVNDFPNRDIWCGFNLYKRVTEGLPVNPVGNSPSFSKPAKDLEDLVGFYQDASVFINSSTVSSVPMALLEAAACACPIVTTRSAAIPEFFTDGLNCWMSNDENVLKDRLKWCLNHTEEAKQMGLEAMQMIYDKCSLSGFLNGWNKIFDMVYGKQL